MASFSYDGTVIQTYTVMTTGTYDITAFGAQGGGLSFGDATGGKGAEVTADLVLTAGTTLKIMVGGAGSAGLGATDGGGGGGTFVVESGTTPVALVVAGGGGGADEAGDDGKAGQLIDTSSSQGGNGPSFGGGGGGGFSTNGGAGNNSGKGGSSFVNGGVGGGNFTGGGSFGVGGYGGGGGGGFGGGGGGGYAGGAGGSDGDGGAGGTSYVVLSALSEAAYSGVESGNGSVTITLACYLAGTLILTARGEVPVEQLAFDDEVLSVTGQRRPIRWIGRRSYAGRFLLANPAAQPIRFRAGSLGGGLPHRDLLVSPNHSMFLDGVLVPARCLVNGSTIVQVRGLKQVDYFHIELDSHDVLLAEGALSESFVDDESRGMFHNAAEWRTTHPEQERAPAVFCAPRVKSGPELEAIRRRLNEVACEVGQAA